MGFFGKNKQQRSSPEESKASSSPSRSESDGSPRRPRDEDTGDRRHGDGATSSSSSSRPRRPRRTVRFDDDVTVRPVPARGDVEEPEKVWCGPEEIGEEQRAVGKTVRGYQKLVDGCPRWAMKKDERAASDNVQGIVKYIKMLLSSKNPTEKMAAQLAARLNRAPSLRGCERQLYPKYESSVQDHRRKVIQMQLDKDFAKKAAEMSRGNVLFGQAVGRHDAAEARS